MNVFKIIRQLSEATKKKRVKTNIDDGNGRHDDSSTSKHHKIMKRPTRNFAEFFAHVKALGFEPKTVIDVGVARGTTALYESFPNAYFYLFEPLKDFEPDLQRIVKNYSGQYHICALMSKSGKSTIFKTKDKFGSSMMHRIPDEADKRLQNVDVRTLDEVIGFSNCKLPILLKTDCQGSDFEVIKGGEITLSLCEIVIMEVSFFKFWGSHHPDPLDILNHMNSKGFVIYDFLDGLFRPLDNALGQIDIVFVKRDGHFRESQKWG